MDRRLIYALVAAAAVIAVVAFRSKMASHDSVEPDPTASAPSSASPPPADSAASASASASASAVAETDSGSTAAGDTPPAKADSDAGGNATGSVAAGADGGHGHAVGSTDSSTVTVDEAKANSTVALGRGQKLVVQLKANPSTGFDWSVIKAPAALGKPEMGSVPAAGEGAVGLRRLTFTLKDALPEGEHTVELGYSRSFEEGKPPLKTFRFKVRSGS